MFIQDFIDFLVRGTKILSMFFLVKGGGGEGCHLPRYRNSGGTFCHPATKKIRAVETTVWAMWFYCDPTLIVLWSYSHFNMIVLWLYRDRTVIMVWSYCVIVLWSICDRSMIFCDLIVILLWSFRYRTVIAL